MERDKYHNVKISVSSIGLPLLIFKTYIYFIKKIARSSTSVGLKSFKEELGEIL